MAVRLSLVPSHLDGAAENGWEPSDKCRQEFDRAAHMMAAHAPSKARCVYADAPVTKVERSAHRVLEAIRPRTVEPSCAHKAPSLHGLAPRCDRTEKNWHCLARALGLSVLSVLSLRVGQRSPTALATMVYRIFLRGNDRGNVKPSLKGFRINTCAWMGVMAERQGFEPWRRFPAYTLSRRAPSTTRPPLRGADM